MVLKSQTTNWDVAKNPSKIMGISTTYFSTGEFSLALETLPLSPWFLGEEHHVDGWNPIPNHRLGACCNQRSHFLCFGEPPRFLPLEVALKQLPSLKEWTDLHRCSTGFLQVKVEDDEFFQRSSWFWLVFQEQTGYLKSFLSEGANFKLVPLRLAHLSLGGIHHSNHGCHDIHSRR